VLSDDNDDLLPAQLGYHEPNPLYEGVITRRRAQAVTQFFPLEEVPSPQGSPGPSLWPPRLPSGYSEPTPPELSLDSLNHGYSGVTPRQRFGPGLSPASVRQPAPVQHLPSSPAAYQGQLSDTPLRRQLLQSPYAYLQPPKHRRGAAPR